MSCILIYGIKSWSLVCMLQLGTSQSRLAVFQGLDSHVWLVDAIVHSEALGPQVKDRDKACPNIS